MALVAQPSPATVYPCGARPRQGPQACQEGATTVPEGVQEVPQAATGNQAAASARRHGHQRARPGSVGRRHAFAVARARGEACPPSGPRGGVLVRWMRSLSFSSSAKADARSSSKQPRDGEPATWPGPAASRSTNPGRSDRHSLTTIASSCSPGCDQRSATEASTTSTQRQTVARARLMPKELRPPGQLWATFSVPQGL